MHSIDWREKQKTEINRKQRWLHLLMIKQKFEIRYSCPVSSRKFLTKNSRGEKEATARTERSWEKLRTEQKTL